MFILRCTSWDYQEERCINRNKPLARREWLERYGEEEWEETIMAFTEIEVLEAENALYAAANAEDMFRLGLMYSTEAEDRGPDFIQAHKWFSLAASLGNKPSKAYREELKVEMNAQDLTMAQRAAREWMDEYQALLAA